ncbi:MAG TPA: hypothetical protein PLH11_02200 [Gemmobacter sp.]|nr:hypothetical protein [Gemmobacter sp.]
MNLIADILMIAGTIGVAIYCYVLAGRLKKFSTLESGMGGAIAVLSAQVDDLTRALEKARGAATGSAATLEALTVRSEMVAARLEVMLASMHDVPEPRLDRRSDSENSDAARRMRFVRRRTVRDDLEAAE